MHSQCRRGVRATAAKYGMLQNGMQDRDLQVARSVLAAGTILRKLAPFVALAAAFAVVSAVIVIIGRAELLQRQYERVINDLAVDRLPNVSADARRVPPQLTVRQTAVLADTAGAYTLVGQVRNPSSAWYAAAAHYRFTLNDRVLAEGTTDIAPEQEKIVLAFRQAVPSSAAAVQLILSDVTWQRATPVTAYAPLALSATNAIHRIITSTPQQQISQVTADIVNTSVETYRNVRVTVLLQSGSAVVGASQLILDTIGPQETRAIDLRFFGRFTVTNIVVQPSIEPEGAA